MRKNRNLISLLGAVLTILVLSCAAAVVITPASAEAGEWKKVYEHRADGTVFSGSINALVTAITNGADVKIRYFRPAGLIDVEWFRTCPSVTIAKEEDSGIPTIVSCILVDIPDTRVDLTVGRDFEAPFALEFHVYNTTGARRLLKFNYQTFALIDDELTTLRIAWFVRE